MNKKKEGPADQSHPQLTESVLIRINLLLTSDSDSGLLSFVSLSPDVEAVWSLLFALFLSPLPF